MSVYPRDPAAPRPQRQRVAAYAVILRDGRLLLSRLAPRISRTALWTLPGGGIDFGEDPALAVVREVHEETGLRAVVGEPFWIGSGTKSVEDHDFHAVRLVYEAAVPADSPDPHVVEVDGSTVEARWFDVEEIRAHTVRTTPMVGEALKRYAPQRVQRVAAYALIRRDEQVLLTRISSRGHRPGAWTLPGGGLEHGEPPEQAVVREVAEETGYAASVSRMLGVHDVHFTGTAPHGLVEDYHGVHLVYEATVPEGEIGAAEPLGTTDAAAWVPRCEITHGGLDVLAVVTAALTMVTED